MRAAWWVLLLASVLGAFLAGMAGLRMQVEGIGLSWPMALGMACLLFAVGYFASCKVEELELEEL